MSYAAKHIFNRICPVALATCVAATTALNAQHGTEGVQNLSQARRVPDVMYIPTPHDVVAEILKEAEVGENDVVYDLGCGDGRIVVLAAKRYGCRAVGIDIDPLRVKDAQRNVRENHVEHLVTIQQGDVFNVDLTAATCVTLYLSTKYNTRLLPQLSKMKSGSRIVSHQFGITGVKPNRIVSVTSQDGRNHNLLLWTLPLP